MKNKYYVSCLDENIKKFIKKSYPDNGDRVFVAPCSFIDYENTDIGIAQKENIISFAGRLNEYKGVLILLDSIKSILTTNKGLKIYILGKGPMQHIIEEFIKQNSLSDSVFLLFLKDPKWILRKSKIFLSLQKDENYPSQSLLEAMACSNAVIATDVGLTHKLVDSSVGILIERNSFQLTNAVNLLLSDSERLNLMGKQARIKVLREHNVDRFMNYLIDIYEE
jgi:GalNAc-alpha-(1->4)-GalNAc-alpha-(1->3)-diNAcBac-PP-undecaprenol alpha-1,4-N-acetyl-D-galactosaminyltransferase